MTASQHHPAQFSPEILDVIAPIVVKWGLPVHDPFAGPGARLGRLCDEHGLAFTGTEIEAPFIEDHRVQPGDSTMPLTYPGRPYAIVTSPAYPNGMADHFRARDDSERHTYRQARAAIVGDDAPLADNNMGRWGVRAGRRAFGRHMAIANRCVRWWPDRAIVNVSDFIMAGDRFPLVEHWGLLLIRHGYVTEEMIPVVTRRQRNGANAEARVDHEVVLVAVRR